MSVRWLCDDMGVAGLLLNIAMMLTIASVGFGIKMRILTMLSMAVGRLTMCVWYVGSVHQFTMT